MRGYDNLQLNQQLVLEVGTRRATGLIADDLLRPHHPITLNGATIAWVQLASGLWVNSFTAATPDYLGIAAASSTDMNFVAQDFSLSQWINPTAVAAVENALQERGSNLVDGWWCNITTNGQLAFYTNQVAANQNTTSANVAGSVAVINTWQQVVFTRSGATARIYLNGAEVSYAVQGVHVNPVGNAARNYDFGRGTSGPAAFGGRAALIKCWSGRVLTAAEVKRMYQMERALFGV